MRLIDADAWKKDIEENYVFTWGSYMKDDVIQSIDAQPTVDAVPVRHGKWTADEILYTQGMAVCSCCKTEYYRDDLYMVGNDAQGELPNYCPNCGATMDEVKE